MNDKKGKRDKRDKRKGQSSRGGGASASTESGMLDALLDDLRADGAVDSEGHFTLDREQARAKLQKFQLVDARRYVLELVQAAVLRGAKNIEFEIDADDMRMRFGGAPFTAAEIDDLYGSLFADGDTRELRGVRQLALALNAAAGMEPKYIHLRSGKIELRMRPGQPDEIETRDAELGETQIHVKQRVRPRLVLDFFLNVSGRLPEEVYLRERCAYAELPIFLDGRRISGGLHINAPGYGSLRVDGLEYGGVMQITRADTPVRVDLVKDGVWIDSRELPSFGTNFVAVVAGERLRKDVSQAKIVEDVGLRRIIQAVGHSRWGLLKHASDQAVGEDVGALAALIREQLLKHSSATELRDDPDARALAEQINWPDCRGEGPRVSLRALMDLVQSGEIPRYASVAYEQLKPEGAPIPLLDERQATRVGRALEAELLEADTLLAREQRRVRGRKAWLGRAGAPVLPTHIEFLVQGSFEQGEGEAQIRGQVGVDVHTLAVPQFSHPVQVLLFTQGRLLGRLELELELPNLWLVIEAPFEPNDDYQDAVRDRTFVRALLAALCALREPLGRLLQVAAGDENQANARALVKRWLVALLDPQQQAALLSNAGVDVTPGAHRSQLLPELSLARLGPDQAADQIALLARQPLFEQLAEHGQAQGPRLSLVDLASHHRKHGHIRYLPSEPDDPRLVVPELMRLGPGDRKIIRALFGEHSCELFDTKARLHQLRHFDQPQVSLESALEQLEQQLASSGVRLERWVVSLEGEVSGFLIPAYGELEALDHPTLAGTTVRVCLDRRALCEEQLELGWGPLLAVMDHPQFQPGPLWQSVEHDALWDAALASLREASVRLFLRVARGYENESGPVRRWLARVLLHGAATAIDSGDRSRLEAIRSLNLFDTVSGSVISLARIEVMVGAGGELEIVDRDTSWAPIKDPEIVKLDDDERGDLRALMAASHVSLADGEARFHHHQVFDKLEQRPPLTEATLGRAQMLVIRDVQGDHRQGEVGISRASAAPSLRLRLGMAGRLVHELHDQGSEYVLPLEAVVIDEQLPLDADGELRADSKRYRQLLRQLRRSVPTLMLELCKDWEQRPEPFQRAAWPMVVAYLHSETDEDRRKVREQAFAAASQISGFCDLWGRRFDLAVLQERARQQPLGLLVSTRPPPPERELGVRPILLVDAAEAACLEAHARIERLDHSWERELALMRERADAPELRRPKLDEVALAQRKAQVAGGLQAELWLPRDYSPLTPTSEAPALCFTRNERELQRVALFDALPCAGIVSGEGLECSGREVELDERQVSSLARQVLIMYIELAERVAAGKGGRLSGQDHERAMEYLAWVNAALEADPEATWYGLTKHVKTLRGMTSSLVAPTLRDSLRRPPVEAAPAPAPAPKSPAKSPVKSPAKSPAAKSQVESQPEAAPAPQVGSRAASDPKIARPGHSGTPHERLLAALYEQLQWARARHGDLLDQLRLAQLELRDTGNPTIAEIHMSGIAVNRQHPLVARLLAPDPPDLDPIDLAFVVAAIYTLMNHYAEEISDDDERVFVAQLAETLVLSQRARASAELSRP